MGSFFIISMMSLRLRRNCPVSLRFSHTNEMNRVMIYSQLSTLNASKEILASLDPMAWQVLRNSARFVMSLDCSWLTDFCTEAFLA